MELLTQIQRDFIEKNKQLIVLNNSKNWSNDEMLIIKSILKEYGDTFNYCLSCSSSKAQMFRSFSNLITQLNKLNN